MAEIPLALAVGLGVFALLVAAGLTASTRRVLGTRVGFARTYFSSVVAVLSLWPLGVLLAEPLGLLDHAGAMVGSPAVILVSALLGLLWIHVAAIVVLVVLEALAPTASIPSFAQMLKGTYGHLRRARRIAQLTKIMSSSGLTKVLRVGPAHEEFTEAVVEAINRSGVTFIKLGQLLATRHDLLPESLTTALARLQTDAAPIPTEVVHQVVREELGDEPEALFRHVESAPLAAASVAQVHEAVTLDGQSVVIKVQRPTARRQVRDDIDVLHHAASIAEERFPWARNMSLVSIVDELMESVRQELDYRVELSNTRAVEASLKDVAHVRTPQPYPELSSARVLVMSKLNGVPLSSARDRLSRMDPSARHGLADDLATALIEGIFVKGVFHSDLHPGNIMLLDDGHLGLLDFGSIGILDSDTRHVLATLLFGIINDDAVTATNAFVLAFDVPDGVDHDQLQRDIGREVALVQGRSDLDTGLFARLFDLAREHGIGIPPGVTAAFRTLAAVETSLMVLNPSMTLLEAARSRMPTLLRRLNAPRRLATQALGSAAVSTSILRRLPMRIEEITSALTEGRLTIDARPFADHSDRTWVKGLVDDAISAALAVAALIVAAMLITSDGGPMVTGTLSLHALVGISFAFGGTVLALRAIIRVFQRRAA